MNKIQFYASVLQITSVCFIVVTAIFHLLVWFTDLQNNQLYVAARYSFDGEMAVNTLSLFQRGLGFLVELGAFFIAVAGILTFNTLMQRFKGGEFFSHSIVQLLNRLSRIALCWALYNPIKQMLLSLIITRAHSITLCISASDIINSFIFSIFVVVTLLMQEGLKLRHEQDLTV